MTRPDMHRRPLSATALPLAASLLAGCVTLSIPSCSGPSGGSTGSRATPRQVNQQKAEQRLETARILMDEGRLDAALAEFGLALEENPNLVEAHLGMGEIFHKRNQIDFAERAYERAANVDPDNVEAHYSLGLMRQLMGNLNQAIESYLRALVIDPYDAKANRDIATAYVQVGRPDYALPYAVRGTELQPDDQAAWCNRAAIHNLLGQYDEALTAYRTATELGVLDDPVLLGLADTHLRLGNYQRAANTLESVIRNKPNATAFERLGYAHFKRRDFPSALEHYRKSLELNPQEVAALNGVGATLLTFYLQGDQKNRAQLEEALGSWRQSLRIRPNQPRIVDLLSRYQRPG
jgi:tetratricopeptide (TPR) repeat protein